MTGDPTYVTPAQLRAAYDALGLDGELFTTTRTVCLHPDTVVATRYLLNENDRQFLDDSGEPVTWSADLPVSDTDPNDMTALLHDGLGDGEELLAALAVDPDETHGCGDPDCHDCGTTA